MNINTATLKPVIFSKIITCCFIFIAVSTKAQIPQLNANISPADIASSALYKEFAGKYDFIIAHHHEGGWSTNGFYYSILAFKGSKRYKIIFSHRKDFSNDPSNKPIIKKELVNKRTPDSVLSVFNKNNFWTLSNDTLNITKRVAYYDVDAHEYVEQQFNISDGLSDSFEIISKNAYLLIVADEPEWYFEKLPEIKQRGQFINAKRAFRSIFPDIYQRQSK